MDCPRCKLPVGGRTFGTEESEYRSLLHRIWNEGSKAALRNENLKDEDCPYDAETEAAKFYAWTGGVYYARLRRLENPAKVAKWLEENSDAEDSSGTSERAV